MGPPNGELMLMLNLALNEVMLNIQYLVMTQMQASANIVLIGICQL